MVLAVTTSVLFLLALVSPYRLHGLHAVSLAAVFVLAVLFIEEGREFAAAVVKQVAPGRWERRDAYDFVAVAGAAVITFYLSIDGGLALGAVVASSAVGLAAAVIKPAYAVPAFCGSFAGMACGNTFTGATLILAAVLAGLVYVMCRHVFNGFGGKLGTVAFSGCLLALLLSRCGFAEASVPDSEIVLPLVAVSILAAVATYAMAVRLRLNVVFSSALVGLIAGVLLPILYPVHGGTLAVMAFCASFAGMSGRQRISNEAYIAVAGVVCAVVFIYSTPYFGGAGGKLGTIAFGSVMFAFGLQKGGRLLARRTLPEGLLLRPVVQSDRCTHCDRCAAVCPVGMLRKLGDRIVVGDARSCIGCLACVEACSADAIRVRRGLRRSLNSQQMHL